MRIWRLALLSSLLYAALLPRSSALRSIVELKRYADTTEASSAAQRRNVAVRHTCHGLMQHVKFYAKSPAHWRKGLSMVSYNIGSSICFHRIHRALRDCILASLRTSCCTAQGLSVAGMVSSRGKMAMCVGSQAHHDESACCAVLWLCEHWRSTAALHSMLRHRQRRLVGALNSLRNRRLR